MPVGNDGFTECSYVCNPENSMQWSCNNYCPDYDFIASTSTIVHSTTQRNENTSIETTEAEINIKLVVLMCIGVVAITIIVITICCCKKQGIGKCVQKCRDKRLQHPTQVQELSAEEDAENGTSDASSIGATEPLVQGEDGNRATVPSENSSDSGVVCVANASVHFFNKPSFAGNTAMNGETRVAAGSTCSNINQYREDTNMQREDDTATFQLVATGNTVPKELEEYTNLAIGQNTRHFQTKVLNATIEPQIIIES